MSKVPLADENVIKINPDLSGMYMYGMFSPTDIYIYIYLLSYVYIYVCVCVYLYAIICICIFISHNIPMHLSKALYKEMDLQPLALSNKSLSNMKQAYRLWW